MIPSGTLGLIIEFEGYSEAPYKCPAGRSTIGYGHVIKEGEKISTVNRYTAKTLLSADVEVAVRCIERNVHVRLADNELSALISLVHNIGVGNFIKSTLLKKLNEGDYKGAAEEIKRWNKINKVPSEGLTRRRNKEYFLFITPSLERSKNG